VGLRDWFRRGGKGPRVRGTSPGGSSLITYGGGEFTKPQLGFSEEDLSDLVARRETVYEEVFGKSDTVFHELMPLVPHVDVYRFPPAGQRNFTTYVSSGMSDLPQSSPAELGKDVRRIELVFYSSGQSDDYSELLRRLAHFPHDNKTWLHWGHTIPNGTPPQPVFNAPPLEALLFIPTIVQPDHTLGERLSWQGEAINLLWCVPITMAECEYKLRNGTDAIFDLFDRVQHPFVFSGARKSYV